MKYLREEKYIMIKVSYRYPEKFAVTKLLKSCDFAHRWQLVANSQ